MNKGLVDKVKNWAFWSLPLKFLVAALAGAIGSSGLIGYLSEYGTYYYAVHYGFRPPLEGIPYLKPAVAFGSFVFLLTCSLLFGFVVLTIRSIIKLLDKHFLVSEYVLKIFGNIEFQAIAKRQKDFLKARTFKAFLWRGTLLSVVSLIYLSVIIYLTDSAEEFWSWYGYYVPAILIALSISYSVFNPQAVWWFAVVFIVAYFLYVASLIFNPEKYAEALRFLGYGGGLNVQITTSGHGENTETIAGGLMIRSNESFIIYLSPEKGFLEIPIDQVRKIEHNLGGLSSLPYSLPITKTLPD